MSDDSLEQIEPGQLIADRYRIEEAIGHGAMGAVWRAVHVRLESPVAIKFLNSSIADDPDMLERFLREARSAAAVRSSHVVQIFDYGVDRGMPYIAMELLVGEPLDERLASRGVLEPPQVDKIFTEVARAVGNAHDLGVVHRDIKPANIFIAREGDHEVTKVLDFGIAKLVDQPLEGPAGSGTHTGIILGTPNYMSPEQARGHRKVDHHSDLWSLAVLAFECLTGRQPFESASLGDLVVKICTAEPLMPSAVAEVPAAFDAWFLRGVAKDPRARFESATEMADELHALLMAEGLGAESRSRSSTDRRFPPEPRERRSHATERASSPPSGSAEPRPGSGRRTSTDPSLHRASLSNTTAEPMRTTGATSTEVIYPTSRASQRWRRIGLAAVLLIGVALALTLGRGPARVDAPVPGGAAAAPTPAPSVPAAPSAAPAAERAPPSGTTAIPAEVAGSALPAVSEPVNSGARLPAGAEPSERARPPKAKGKEPAAKTSTTRPSAKLPATPDGAAAPKPLQVDPFSDRL